MTSSFPYITLSLLISTTLGTHASPPSPPPSIAQLEQQIREGRGCARLALAHAYYRGQGTRRDYTKAYHWYKSAYQQREPRAELYLARCYYKGQGTKQDYTKAVKLFQIALSNGDDLAAVHLATCYVEGTGVRRSSAEALTLAHYAIQFATPEAQHFMATLYLHGHGVRQDRAKGREYLKQAAAQGFAPAQQQLKEMEQQEKRQKKGEK